MGIGYTPITTFQHYCHRGFDRKWKSMSGARGSLLFHTHTHKCMAKSTQVFAFGHNGFQNYFQLWFPGSIIFLLSSFVETTLKGMDNYERFIRVSKWSVSLVSVRYPAFSRCHIYVFSMIRSVINCGQYLLIWTVTSGRYPFLCAYSWFRRKKLA